MEGDGATSLDLDSKVDRLQDRLRKLESNRIDTVMMLTTPFNSNLTSIFLKMVEVRNCRRKPLSRQHVLAREVLRRTSIRVLL